MSKFLNKHSIHYVESSDGDPTPLCPNLPGKRVKLVVQPSASPKSLSEAVLCARPLIGTQPFLLLLGDHIYHSLTPGLTCAQQLAEFWANAGSRPRPLVALRSTPASQIHRFGTIGGVMDMEVQFSADRTADEVSGTKGVGEAADAAAHPAPLRTIDIHQFKEKPTVQYAEAYLRIAISQTDGELPDMGADGGSATGTAGTGVGAGAAAVTAEGGASGEEEARYMTVFGQYVLPAQIFDIIEGSRSHADADEAMSKAGSVMHFTDALEELRKREGFVGVDLTDTGLRFDVGDATRSVEVSYARVRACVWRGFHTARCQPRFSHPRSMTSAFYQHGCR